MQRLDCRYVYSATDLNNYLECRHLTGLSRLVADKLLVPPDVVDETAELVKRKGDEHEKARLAQYVDGFGTGVVRFDERVHNSIEAFEAAEARTRDAMAAGAKIIYQATFFDGQFVGHADFLRRVERTSAHYAWSYEVLDTKLALTPKPYFLIQLCNYSEHLERVQGVAPANGYVVFGNGAERAFRIADYAAYYRHLKSSYLQAVDAGGEVYPVHVGHCDICNWNERCEERRERDDYLGLVAGIRAEQIAKLESAGITTMTALGEATARPQRMTEATFDNLRIQAALQVEQRARRKAGDSFPYRYRFRESDAADAAAERGDADDAAPDGAPEKRETAGFAKMPPPADGDVFFDIEGDPLYRPERGLEYLFGLYVPGEDRYIAYWAKDATQERAAFEACVDFIAERRARYPEMHVYHYASYERTVLGRLMGTYASRENEIDAFFTIGLFVDLYPVVRQAMWLSQPSYSLKKVEKFYAWTRATQTKGGDDSIVMFESWLVTGNDSILEDIERYNEDDCRSTYALREWLIGMRAEYNAQAQVPIPWRAVLTAPVPVQAPERTELEGRLLAGIAPPQTLAELHTMHATLAERWLLGNLLQYHRREDKPAYWEYFERCKNVEDLAEFDRKAIGGLVRLALPPVKRPRKKHSDYRFTYPPQEHDLRGTADCPDTRKSVNEIVAHDEIARVITLQIPEDLAGTIRAVIPGPPLPHKKRQEGIERIATSFLAGRLAADHPATSALIRNETSRFANRLEGARIQPGTVDGASLSAAFAALDGSYLFVQGPPGTGKSTLGAAAIVDLLRAGKRVGLMANGHKALHGLLAKIEGTARLRGLRFDGAHKMSATEDSDYVSPFDTTLIRNESDTTALLDAQLISGTAYFWPDERLTGLLDVIVIDEAGQVAIADALNASMTARNVVLLGDPQQLPQVTQGTHPIGAGSSILQHLLGDHDTIPPHRGIFLDVSYRMQPQIATFVSETSYDGRLRAAPQTAGNRVASPAHSGGGLVYLPVSHAGNGRSSPEEADRIVAEIERLTRGTFVRSDEPETRLRAEHILVVTPYNRQRRLLRERLDRANLPGVAVGTVDKFQGQEAPVVFYSMATSSGDDLPRDMTFLFDRNRFNVAVSRAQCLSILVCSPQLLETRCRNPEQMLLVNLLCTFAERAAPHDFAKTPAPLEVSYG